MLQLNTVHSYRKKCLKAQVKGITSTNHSLHHLLRLGLALRPRAGLPFLGPEGGGRTNA
jgi:hypothetical protein